MATKHQVLTGRKVTRWRPSQSDYVDAPTVCRNWPKSSASYRTRFGLFARRIKPQPISCTVATWHAISRRLSTGRKTIHNISYSATLFRRH